MKRTALLLAILAVFSITSVSQVCALPVAGSKAVTVSNWLSYCFANFLRAHCHNLGNKEGIIGSDGHDEILRGDADDYANGRSDEKILGPDDLSDDLPGLGSTLSGGITTGSGGVRAKY